MASLKPHKTCDVESIYAMQRRRKANRMVVRCAKATEGKQRRGQEIADGRWAEISIVLEKPIDYVVVLFSHNRARRVDEHSPGFTHWAIALRMDF